MDINSISWDSTLLKVQFSNGKVIAFENITFSEYQQLLSCLTAADKPSIVLVFEKVALFTVEQPFLLQRICYGSVSILDGHIIKLSEVVLSECLSEILFLIKLKFYVISKTLESPWNKVFLQLSKTAANSLFKPVIAYNSLF